jgi:D-glycero-D-manno-heptose 1,7-bisphosphate phosphatase
LVRIVTANAPSRGAVFLDRDGTLNVEVNYLYRVDDLHLISGAAQAIRRLNEAGYLVIVVTNQAGIARGYYAESDLHALHEHMAALLAAEGARIDAFYFCPHHPDFTGPCSCRKPAPGMLRAAERDHNLDLRQSWLIGDTAGDVGAGVAAGCRTILVRTGYGARTEPDLAEHQNRPDAVVDDIGAAVRWLLEQDRVL